MQCVRCGGDHATEGCKRSLFFQGYEFAPPYLCMCCGNEIGARRWRTNHSCERCEWGACGQPEPPHSRPLWRDTDDGTEAFELYAAYVEAIPHTRPTRS